LRFGDGTTTGDWDMAIAYNEQWGWGGEAPKESCWMSDSDIQVVDIPQKIQICNSGQATEEFESRRFIYRRVFEKGASRRAKYT